MDSREFSEWLAYFTLEPWGEERADLRMALLTCLTANINRKKGSTPYSPTDFMPFTEKPKAEADEAEELKSFLKSRYPER